MRGFWPRPWKTVVYILFGGGVSITPPAPEKIKSRVGPKVMARWPAGFFPFLKKGMAQADNKNALQGKRWCMTLNNYTDADVEAWKQWDIVYGVVGKEKGEQGTDHLQGFFIFKKNVWLTALKKLSPRAHWERAACRKNEPPATYCKKEGNFEEKGKLPERAKKEDKEAKDEERSLRWSEALDAAKNGDLESIDAEIMVKHYNNLRQIAKDNMKKKADLDAPTGIWIVGKPGVGKSRAARIMAPDAYIKMQNKWWDGYQYEDDVILDDFDAAGLSHHLKIWADQYAFTAEIKGSAMNIRPKRFIITSNYTPKEMGWDEITTEAIARRFKMFTIEKKYGELQEISEEGSSEETPAVQTEVGSSESDSGSYGCNESIQEGEELCEGSSSPSTTSTCCSETCSIDEGTCWSSEGEGSWDRFVQPVADGLQASEFWSSDDEEGRQDFDGEDYIYSPSDGTI